MDGLVREGWMKLMAHSGYAPLLQLTRQGKSFRPDLRLRRSLKLSGFYKEDHKSLDNTLADIYLEFNLYL